MNTYLIIEDDKVTNAILWDGKSDWTPPEGAEVIPAPDGVGVGWERDGDSWVAPAESTIDG